MTIVDRLRRAASTVGATVVFPEGEDHRVLQGAARLAAEGAIRPLLLGNARRIHQTADAAGIGLSSWIRVIDPECPSPDDAPALADAVRDWCEDGRLGEAEAAAQLRDPVTLAALLVRAGEADGCVAGAAHPTERVLRAALRVVGLAEEARLMSSTFLMVLANGAALTFADCAVVPDPSAEELADIAVTSARTHAQLTGTTPHVAMLSFSTKGSAEHESVSKVREATRHARTRAPDLAIDGELQFDAAYAEAVGAAKAPASAVAGRANVFIFPNLDAANIAYKITERLANAEAIGPILQGLAKPIHDLSRGCKPDDVVTVAAICALQARRDPSP